MTQTYILPAVTTNTCDDTSGKSPAPGCDRRNLSQIPTIVFHLHQISQTQANPLVQQKLRDAIAALGEVIIASSL